MLVVRPHWAGAQEASEVAAEAAAEDPEHDKLRAVRTGLVEAYNKGDIDGILAFCHPAIVVTWQNGEVTKGRDELRAYYERMLIGDDAIVEKLTADPQVDELSTIYGGDVALARGSMNDEFLLTDGSSFAMNSRWSATLVKENDEWLVADFHPSVNAFDNGVLWMIVRRTAWLAAGVALVAGLIVGVVAGRLFKRRQPAAT